jgi:hypothetical protein
MWPSFLTCTRTTEKYSLMIHTYFSKMEITGQFAQKTKSHVDIICGTFFSNPSKKCFKTPMEANLERPHMSRLRNRSACWKSGQSHTLIKHAHRILLFRPRNPQVPKVAPAATGRKQSRLVS